MVDFSWRIIYKLNLKIKFKLTENLEIKITLLDL